MYYFKVFEKDFGDGIFLKCRVKYRFINNNAFVSWVDKKVFENVND